MTPKTCTKVKNMKEAKLPPPPPHPQPPYSTSVVHTHRNLVHCYVNNTSNNYDEVEQVPSVYKVVLRKENKELVSIV